MRAKAHQYSTHVQGTFTNGTDVIGITGDFDGGFVLACVALYANVGSGGYESAAFKVDGVVQGQGAALGQVSVVNTLTYTALLRVPQGRHRISVAFGTAAAPVASATADLSVAELPA